jgi:hypothetical protein
VVRLRRGKLLCSLPNDSIYEAVSPPTKLFCPSDLSKFFSVSSWHISELS